MDKYLISVVIPVYNRSNELELTLNSLKSQTLDKSKFEVIVADDGSKEEIPLLLKKYSDLNITYCYQEDLGFRVAEARNLGINIAQGEVIVFNDNGILLTPDVLERHIKRHSEKKNYVILGYMFGTSWDSDFNECCLLFDKYSPYEAIQKMKKIGNMGDGREHYIKNYGDDLAKWYIPWLGLWGGHFSVRQDFLTSNNIVFDKEFKTWGGEDIDFGIQLCRAGGYYLLDKSIEVVHYPTPDEAKSMVKGDDFKENYKRVQVHIANKYKDDDVIVWQNIGSSANNEAKRAEFLKNFNG